MQLSVSLHWGERSIFEDILLYLLRCLSAHDFIYPKILFHAFEEERLLFQTK